MTSRTGCTPKSNSKHAKPWRPPVWSSAEMQGWSHGISSAWPPAHTKAPALPPGAHRHVPRALWLFARKRECRHLMSLRIGMQIAESHYLAKPYRMMCLSITQLLFDFFRNSSPTTFRAADKRRLRCWPAAGMNAARPRRRGPSSRLCLRLTLLR